MPGVALVNGWMRMDAISLEQAVYLNRAGDHYDLVGRSPGFREEWLPLAERLCAGFGARPPGLACPACVFAQPFGKEHIAVVQVRDQGTDYAGRPAALGFHLLILSRSDYRALGGDPFVIAEQFPASGFARGDRPTLTWPVERALERTVEQVRQVLREADGPNMLGGAQALVDGGHLVFERSQPDEELLRRLWILLPTSTRWELWPASFAFSNALGFDVLVVPDAQDERFAGYLRGEQAGDYPEGRYELNLQIAAEDGDQRELDALLARRSRRETWRLGLLLLGMCLVLALVGNLLLPPAAPEGRARGKPPIPAPPEKERGR